MSALRDALGGGWAWDVAAQLNYCRYGCEGTPESGHAPGCPHLLAVAELDALEGFARWIARMDDPADPEGVYDRQTIGLTRIVERAVEALGP